MSHLRQRAILGQRRFHVDGTVEIPDGASAIRGDFDLLRRTGMIRGNPAHCAIE